MKNVCINQNFFDKRSGNQTIKNYHKCLLNVNRKSTNFNVLNFSEHNFTIRISKDSNGLELSTSLPLSHYDWYYYFLFMDFMHLKTKICSDLSIFFSKLFYNFSKIDFVCLSFSLQTLPIQQPSVMQNLIYSHLYFNRSSVVFDFSTIWSSSVVAKNLSFRSLMFFLCSVFSCSQLISQRQRLFW